METSSTFSSPHTLWRAGGMNTLLDSSRKRISSPHHILNVHIPGPGQPGSVHSRSTCSRRYCRPVQADCQQRVLITDSTWTYVAPVNLGVYSAAALAAGGNVTQCTQIINNHKVKQLSYPVYSEFKKPAMISPFMASEMMHLRPSISSLSTLSTHQPRNAKDTYTTRRSR